MTMRQIVAALSLGLAAAQPLAAQDFFMPGTSPMDLAPQSQALTSSVIGNLSVEDTARRGGGGGRAYAPPVGRGGAFSPGRASDARLPYASTAASRRQALEAYVARAARKSPETRSFAAELRRRNVEQEMQAAMRPYGLSANDAADVMTAFLIVGWEVMSGRDVTRAQAQGIRRQVAGQLVATGAVRNPATRTRFAEELKITTFILGGGAASARRDGDMAQYRRGIANFYRTQTGEDIGRWRVTSAGFQR